MVLYTFGCQALEKAKATTNKIGISFRVTECTRNTTILRCSYIRNVKEKNKLVDKDTVVVELGVSAEGLDSLQRFFKSLPEKTGMTFILVHLPGEYKNNLAELLEMQTPLRVFQVTEKTRIKQECVYVIPPKKLFSIDGNYIELLEPDKITRHATAGLLFSSLTEAMGGLAVTIITYRNGSGGAEAKKMLEETNRQLEKELRESNQYQREILNNSIVERWKIGGYLHDNLAQVLVSVKIIMADINKNLPDSSKEIIESISVLSRIIDEAISGIRNLTHDIIPVDIEEGGVSHAFRFLVRQTQRLHKVNCKLITDETINKIKNRKLATNLYHVVEEAIKNAAIHGKADHIEISLLESGVNVILQIKDDGIGLSNSPRKSKGKGLRIIKHRLELLGGTFHIKEISGSDETGTRVTCTIPMEDLLKKEM